MGGGHGPGVTYKGVTLHQPKRWHTVTGKGLCAVMWKTKNGLSSKWESLCHEILMENQFSLRTINHSCAKGFGFSTEQNKMVLWYWAGGILGKAMMITTRTAD